MFVLQLGSATFLITEPVVSAMTTGAATHVVTSQAKYLLGMKMPHISGPLGFFYVSLPLYLCSYVYLGMCVSHNKIWLIMMLRFFSILNQLGFK